MERNENKKGSTPVFDSYSDYNSDEDSFIENEKLAQETPTLPQSQQPKPWAVTRPKFRSKNEARKHLSKKSDKVVQEYNDDYEEDFDDLSDNEPEHKITVNPKFNIKSII